jgi:hypothetical protein
MFFLFRGQGSGVRDQLAAQVQQQFSDPISLIPAPLFLIVSAARGFSDP